MGRELLRQAIYRCLLGETSIWIQAAILRAVAAFSRPMEIAAQFQERIVVVKLDRIGDFVLVTPFLRELRRSRPDAWITLVVSEAVGDLAMPCPHVNSITLAPRRSPGVRGIVERWNEWLRIAWSELIPLRPTVAILPRWDTDIYDAYALLALSGARRRISYSTHVSEEKHRQNRGADRLLTDAIPSSSHLHEVERNLDLLPILGAQAANDQLESLWIADHGADLVARYLPGSAGQILVGLCPFSAEQCKDWPFERFLELTDRFTDRPYITFVIFCGPEYADVSDRPEVRSRSNLRSLAGALSLRETAILLRHCDLILSVDTGLAHMTAALRRPLIMISGLPLVHDSSNRYSPARFGPWRSDCTLVGPPIVDDGVLHIEAVTLEQVETAVLARIPVPR